MLAHSEDISSLVSVVSAKHNVRYRGVYGGQHPIYYDSLHTPVISCELSGFLILECCHHGMTMYLFTPIGFSRASLHWPSWGLMEIRAMV